MLNRKSDYFNETHRLLIRLFSVTFLVEVYRKILVISPGLIQLCKACLVRKQNNILAKNRYFSQYSVTSCIIAVKEQKHTYRSGYIRNNVFFTKLGGL